MSGGVGHEPFEDILERLLRHRRINPTTGCWEWTGSLNRFGYGNIGIDDKSCRPHRVMAELVFGASDLDVLHLCHIRRCFRPRHLRYGSEKENVQARWLTPRLVEFSYDPRAILVERQAASIKDLPLRGNPLNLWRVLARRRIDPKTGCWIWTGWCNKRRGGYGGIWIAKKLYLIHRIFAMVFLGKPRGERRNACHTCDRPPCFNPAHLFWGTHSDNAADMKAKGRARGSHERKPHPTLRKLSTAQARYVLRNWRPGLTPTMARFFKVGDRVIKLIVLRETYRDVMV